jgi:hypothetical protein
MRANGLHRRDFLRLLGGAVLCAAGPAWGTVTQTPAQRGIAFLTRAQGADGAWRSAHYGFFRGGDALTPMILMALRASPENEASARGERWLDALTDRLAAHEAPWLELRYPLFSASYAAQFYSSRGDSPRAAVWAGMIESLQLTAALGWPAGDPRHGAWGDASVPLQRPPGEHVPDMMNPNLSATLYAIQGLCAAGCIERARLAAPFIERCQNFSAKPKSSDDGGFFFAMDDPVRNKAGVAGKDATGRERYRSYGSATCDGILALLALGRTPADPRVAAAMNWLRTRTARFEHAGKWPADRADSGRAHLFYYAQALAQVLRSSDETWTAQSRRALSAGLSHSQSDDGTWRNADPESCEDDPLVATAFAITALA